jgi:hypothetical protein
MNAIEEVEGKIIIWANYRKSIFDIKEALAKKVW